VRDGLPATIGIADAPFAAALRAGGRRVRSFALNPDGASARLEYLHQPLSQRQHLRTLPAAADVLEIVQRSEDVGPLPRRKGHTVRYIGSFWDSLELRDEHTCQAPRTAR
jgi:hypothetical protein